VTSVNSLFTGSSVTNTPTSSLSSSPTPSPSAGSPAFDFVNPPSTPSNLVGSAGSHALLQHDEPVQLVLESLREQRMSLCQTLRQYVFAHRAIIEGVFEIMDELSQSDKLSPDLLDQSWNNMSNRRSSVKRRHRSDSLSHLPVSKVRQR